MTALWDTVCPVPAGCPLTGQPCGEESSHCQPPIATGTWHCPRYYVALRARQSLSHLLALTATRHVPLRYPGCSADGQPSPLSHDSYQTRSSTIPGVFSWRTAQSVEPWQLPDTFLYDTRGVQLTDSPVRWAMTATRHVPLRYPGCSADGQPSPLSHDSYQTRSSTIPGVFSWRTAQSVEPWQLPDWRDPHQLAFPKSTQPLFIILWTPHCGRLCFFLYFFFIFLFFIFFNIVFLHKIMLDRSCNYHTNVCQ